MVEVYPPLDTISERILSPLLVQTVTLPDAGGPVAVVFNDLQPGRYAAVAFIDFNDNGRFDIEESGVKSEPFSLARRLGPTRRPTIDDASHSKDVNPTGEAEELPAGIFELVTDQATLIVFDFVSAVPSEWEGVAKPVASPKESQK